MNRGRAAAAIAILAALAVVGGVQSASSATPKVKLANVKGFEFPLTGAQSPQDVYDVYERSSVSCGKKGTPLAAGWSNAGAIVSSVRTVFESSSPYLELSTRRPMTSGKLRPFAICAKGPVRATVATKPSGEVSCSKKIAIGVAVTSTWPYSEQAAIAKPISKSSWQTSAPYSASTAVCVASKAFAKVKTVRRTAAFASGKRTASVTAKCAGKRRPIGWGYEAPTMEGNAWASADTPSRLTVPFIAASTPKGKKSWTLSFQTPDGKGAAAAAQVGIHLTCAVPR